MKFKKSLPALALLGLSIGNAQAAPLATAEAVLDWGQFQVTSLLGASITWANAQYSSGYAHTYSPEDWQYTSGYSTATAGNSATQGQVTVSASTMSSYAKDSNTASDSYANAYSSYNDSFTVNGDGIILFSVPYTLKATLNAGDVWESNSANSSVSFSAYEYSDAGSGSLYAQKSIYLWDGNAAQYSPLTKSGILTLSMSVLNGETYSLHAGTQSWANVTSETAPVPVPAAAWLLGSGLLGLVGIARRKTA